MTSSTKKIRERVLMVEFNKEEAEALSEEIVKVVSGNNKHMQVLDSLYGIVADFLD